MRHDPSLEFLPEWLPDETLFSLASRYHRLAGHVAGRHTSRILFGSSRSGYQHDLPSGIDHFVGATKNLYGQTNHIIRTRTLLPYYLAFKTRSVAKDALASMRSQRIGHLKYRLGILTSGTRAHHPLKACNKCIDEDHSAFGVAYWHLNHQFPGVLICLKHQLPLLTSTLKSSGVMRFGYFLPDDSEADLQEIQPSPSAQALLLLRTLSEIGITTSRIGRKARLNLAAFGMSCDAVFRKKHLLSKLGRLRQKQATAEFAEFIAPIATHAEFDGIPKEPRTISYMLARLHSLSAHPPHPMRIISVIAWLFGSYERYQATAKQAIASNAIADNDSEELVSLDDANEQQQRFLNRLNDGESVSRAAVQVGVDPAVGIGWARLHNMNVTRRRKHVRGDLLNQIRQRLNAGHTKQRISKELGVSVSSVSRVLYAEPSLANAWQRRRHANERDKRRESWKRLVSSHGHLGTNVLRGIEPATFTWLYRNDRAWLEMQRERIATITAKPTPRVDWAERDHELEKELSKAIELIAISTQPTPITVGRLCQHVPNLKRRLGQTNRLPKTKQLLDRILRKGGSKNHSGSLPLT